MIRTPFWIMPQNFKEPPTSIYLTKSWGRFGNGRLIVQLGKDGYADETEQERRLPGYGRVGTRPAIPFPLFGEWRPMVQ